MSFRHLNIDRSWTIFLDRDGVINKRIQGDYVRHSDDMILLPKTAEAMKIISGIFRYVIVVTNQQGIGKGLYTEADLARVHQKMQEEITNNGGRIDLVLFAPQLASENHPDRKPGVGMAYKAKEAFPDISFSRSIMVGDSESDMIFGKTAGMTTVFITSSSDHSPGADFTFDSLWSFALALRG